MNAGERDVGKEALFWWGSGGLFAPSVSHDRDDSKARHPGTFAVRVWLQSQLKVKCLLLCLEFCQCVL